MIDRRDVIRNKVLSRVVIDEVTGCWLWTGPTSGEEGRGAGYPRMSLGGRRPRCISSCGQTSTAIFPARRNSITSAATASVFVRTRSTWKWSPASETPSAGNRRSAG